jgi:hypothetical protein
VLLFHMDGPGKRQKLHDMAGAYLCSRKTRDRWLTERTLPCGTARRATTPP